MSASNGDVWGEKIKVSHTFSRSTTRTVIVGMIVLACGVCGLAIGLSNNSAQADASSDGVSSQATGAQVGVEQAFVASENLYESIQAPPPGQENTAGTGSTSLSGLNNDVESVPVDRWNSQHTAGELSGQDAAYMLNTANALLPDYFDPTETASIGKIVQNAVATYQNGNFMGGGGGASVVCYYGVDVNGSSAEVNAVVAQWLKLGLVQNGAVSWQTEQAQLSVDDRLVLSSAGTWLVTNRTWQFLPGNGPGAVPQSSTTTTSIPPSMACPPASTSPSDTTPATIAVPPSTTSP